MDKRCRRIPSSAPQLPQPPHSVAILAQVVLPTRLEVSQPRQPYSSVRASLHVTQCSVVCCKHVRSFVVSLLTLDRSRLMAFRLLCLSFLESSKSCDHFVFLGCFDHDFFGSVFGSLNVLRLVSCCAGRDALGVWWCGICQFDLDEALPSWFSVLKCCDGGCPARVLLCRDFWIGRVDWSVPAGFWI